MDVFKYLTREQWQARPPKTVRTVLPHQFTAIEFHHSATGVMSPAAAAQSFQKFHMDTKKWQDLFYNWLIHPDGTIVEGRGWGTSPRNENFMVICFIGNYDQIPVTQSAQDAGSLLVRECWRRMPQLAGKDVRWHNQRDNTGCPGKNLVQFVKEQNVMNAWGTPTGGEESDMAGPTGDEWNQLASNAFAINYRAERRARNAQTLLEEMTDLYDDLAELADMSEDHLNAVRRLRKEYDNG